MNADGIRPCRPLAEEDLAHVLECTRGCWEEAHGQDFFVTGGTGFVGIWLLESFAFINDRLKLGAGMTVLTRRPEAFAEKVPHLAGRNDLRLLKGDVRDFAFPPGQYPFVIHAATATQLQPGAAAQAELLDEIVTGTQRVLALAERAGTQKLLFTSSGAVYGPQPHNLSCVPEDFSGEPDPQQANSAYGIGKRRAEGLCAAHAQAHGYAAKIARCFAFVGPHLPMDGRYAIGNFIRDALNRQPVRVAGDGTAVRSYLYAADLAAWLWIILFRGTAARAYNVGSMQGLNIAAVAETVRAALGGTQPVQVAGVPVSGSAPSRYVPDVTRAKVELGLKESFPLPEAIRRTARWTMPAAHEPAS